MWLRTQMYLIAQLNLLCQFYLLWTLQFNTKGLFLFLIVWSTSFINNLKGKICNEKLTVLGLCSQKSKSKITLKLSTGRSIFWHDQRMDNCKNFRIQSWIHSGSVWTPLGGKPTNSKTQFKQSLLWFILFFVIWWISSKLSALSPLQE